MDDKKVIQKETHPAPVNEDFKKKESYDDPGPEKAYCQSKSGYMAKTLTYMPI